MTLNGRTALASVAPATPAASLRGRADVDVASATPADTPSNPSGVPNSHPKETVGGGGIRERPTKRPTASRRVRLTDAERRAVDRFLFGALLMQAPAPLNTWGMRDLTREQQSESYQSWARGGHAWNALEQGGTGQLAAICWYQHIYRPGSKEWRPSIIIRALVAEAVKHAA